MSFVDRVEGVSLQGFLLATLLPFGDQPSGVPPHAHEAREILFKGGCVDHDDFFSWLF